MIKCLSFTLLAAFALVSTEPCHSATTTALFELRTPADVGALFPKSVEEMEQNFEQTKTEALDRIETIVSIPADERTYENTVRECDRAVASFYVHGEGVKTFLKVYPDAAMRTAAQAIAADAGTFFIEQFETNRNLYRAFVEYQTGNALNDNLNPERAYHLADMMDSFRRQGLELNAEDFERMKELKNELNILCLDYDTNISQDNSALHVTKEQLVGIEDNFISGLGRDGDLYILRCDYPTRAQVLENCTVEATRRRYNRMFNNRAYPQNETLLTEVINTRDTLAKLLGFSSFAELDISSQMAKTPETVSKFLETIAEQYTEKADAEWALLLQELPESVTLTEEGKVKPWDVAFLHNYYKKNHLHIDNEKIAEYFPMETVVQGLLDVYGKFFGLRFEVVPAEGLWDADVQLIAVSETGPEASLVGYLILDLFPRENKYSHACCESLWPPISWDEGKTYAPALTIVIANFSKSTDSKPSLFQHQEVEVLFHEFGHAIHALLGRAEMPSKAAFNTKIDFVEAPSQLLEEWVWDADVLKILSRHYQTGEPLPDALVQQMIDTANFDEGRLTLRQIGLAKTSLNCFSPGQDKDLVELQTNVYGAGAKYVAFDPEGHSLCSFGHLTNYGAKYYSYLWSKQLAKQLFSYIGAHGGPLDPILGERYRTKVIGRGGSCEPQELVTDFLSEASQ